MPLTFDERNNLECGNLLISLGVYEDERAAAQGHEFLGVAADANGVEVHVFRMAPLEFKPLSDSAIETLTVYMLAISPVGENVLVKGTVPLRKNNDGDFSVEISSAEKKLTSLCYTICGSFLATDPAAKLVNLAECVQVFA